MTIHDCVCVCIQTHLIHRFAHVPHLTSACVRPHSPRARVGQARWRGKVGLGVASSMDPVTQMQSARQSGRARQDRLADGCPRIMAGWHLQGQQAVRLTDLPLQPPGSLPDPLLNPLPSRAGPAEPRGPWAKSIWLIKFHSQSGWEEKSFQRSDES